MKNILHALPMMKVQIDGILESAVILSWKDLLHPSERGLMHIEHAPGTRFPYVKIWQLTGKGQWSLVCEYWMPGDSAMDGMAFSNGYGSAGLAEMLKVIMQHQDNFAPSLATSSAAVIQVTLPTEQESLAATASMKNAYDGLGLTFTRIPVAAAA